MFRLLPILALLFSGHLQAQLNEGLQPEERAYLFHVVKKSPILNENFGRFFDYQGPDIRFPNNLVNFDSIEILIINQPDLLVIRKEEIAKSPKGLIAEAANKMALWELNKVLHAKRNDPDDLKQYKNEYELFERYLMTQLTANALREDNGEKKPHPKVIQMLNPALTFDEKLAVIENQKFLSKEEMLQVVNALNYAVNAYTEDRSFAIFKDLGGRADEFTNVLVAAGDGSSTTGMLEEREKDENGRWNKGLPKAVGLFPYQVRIDRIEEKKKVLEVIEPLRYTVNNFSTSGSNQLTNVHFDVWGYNTSKQTTVVLEKNGLSYHLFGSGETRFLSPDSTFSSGTTFQSVINDLEFNKIADLNEKIYGKKGITYWIEYNQKKKDATELKIEKREKEYSDMGYSPITTSVKPSGKVKRSKKKAIKSSSPTFDATPTTKSNKKERKELQQTIVDLYNQFEGYRLKIIALEKEKAEAIDLLAIYQRRLDQFKQYMGYRWASYIEKDGLYIFEDSSTFDIRTQEFQFPPSQEKVPFEVRLLSIPESCLSNSSDEVMLHINITNAIPDYDARINIALLDVFDSDDWRLDRPLFEEKDSVALHLFFEALLDKKLPLSFVTRGQGVGTWNGSKVVKHMNPEELNNYPGDPSLSKLDSTFLRLRKTELMIDLDREIQIEINSFTDPVRSSLNLNKPVFMDAMAKYKLSKNDILSAHRSYTVLNKLKKEVNILAGRYLSREEARLVIDRFNKEFEKTRISVGPTSFKLSDFE